MEGKIRFVFEYGELDNLEPDLRGRGRAAAALQRPDQPPQTREENRDYVYGSVPATGHFLYLLHHQLYQQSRFNPRLVLMEQQRHVHDCHFDLRFNHLPDLGVLWPFAQRDSGCAWLKVQLQKLSWV